MARVSAAPVALALAIITLVAGAAAAVVCDESMCASLSPAPVSPLD